MTLPIMKRINAELFIDRMAALYIHEKLGSELGPMRVISKLVLADWWPIEYILSAKLSGT